MRKKYFNFLVVILFVLFFLGGFGWTRLYISLMMIILNLSLLVQISTFGQKLKSPKNFLLYIFFLIFSVIGLIWSKDKDISYETIMLLMSGGSVYLTFYNLSRYFKDKQRTIFLNSFSYLILGLGVFYSLLFLHPPTLNISYFTSWSLYLYADTLMQHVHLGDLLAVVMAVTIIKVMAKGKYDFLWLIPIPVIIYLLTKSLSRSAYVALIAGVIYLFKGKLWVKKSGWFLKVIIIVFTGLFLFAGREKSVLFSRPYYFQAIAGFLHNPFGVGMGNFGVISLDPQNWIFGMNNYSMVVHNLLLEVLVGTGIFSVIFFVWFYRVCRDLWFSKNKTGLIFRVIFIVLTVNFLFDYTYFIPTMLWLWFASLGLVQE